MRSAPTWWTLVSALLLVTGCASRDDTTDPRRPDVHAEELGHVHGLGIDPADGALYAATHFGVLRVDEDGSLTRIADRWQDTMAFTVVGPGHFLGSGHPDLRENLPVHLGLIESRDAAGSWSALSLAGEADFHALDVSGDRTYGYDATSGKLMTTTDRQAWTTLTRGRIVDLAADPSDPDRVISSTPDGELRFHTVDSSGSTPLTAAPDVLLLEWPSADRLVGMTGDGRVYWSEDAGATWTRRPDVPGSPEAFDATDQLWHVATDRDIHRSDDEGRSWTMLVGAGH